MEFSTIVSLSPSLNSVMGSVQSESSNMNLPMVSDWVSRWDFFFWSVSNLVFVASRVWVLFFTIAILPVPGEVSLAPQGVLVFGG